MAAAPGLPLSALLSQVLVAFTVEFDNEFERRMAESGDPGARLSLRVWTDLMKFIGPEGVAVRDLEARGSQSRFQLGCLERWGFVAFPEQPGLSRPGWGSARGIRVGWTVRLTARGMAAGAIWPPLFEEIEQRWRARFGPAEIGRLQQALRQAGGEGDTLPALLHSLVDSFGAEFEPVISASAQDLRQHAAGARRNPRPCVGAAAPNRLLARNVRHRLADQTVRSRGTGSHQPLAPRHRGATWISLAGRANRTAPGG
jgi:hypothetical protein